MPSTPLVLLFALASSSSSLSSAPPPDAALTKLEGEIERISRKAGGVVGVSALHIESGRTVSQNSTLRFPMASTYKLPLALAVLHAVDEGKLKLDQKLPVTENDLREGMGIETLSKRWKPGLTAPVSELLDLMITESDNGATDLLFTLVGGPAVVQSRLKALGLSGIDVNRTEQGIHFDLLGLKSPPAERTCSPGCVRSIQAKVSAADKARARTLFEKDVRDTTTPAAMATLNSRLLKGELLSKKSTDFLLDAMKRCKTGDARLRALLPPGTEVFDKTGTVGRSTNDTGILTLPKGAGHLAIAVYVKSSPAESKVRERVIAEIARAVYDAFSVPGPSSKPPARS